MSTCKFVREKQIKMHFFRKPPNPSLKRSVYVVRLDSGWELTQFYGLSLLTPPARLTINQNIG